MFDVGFSELLLIAVVALLVLGPERLPKAARFAGLWIRRARAQWFAVKNEFENELAAEELRRGLRDTETALQRQQAELGRQVEQALDAAAEAPAPPKQDAPPP
jgi:sec-independent protein translocase protein TatB